MELARFIKWINEKFLEWRGNSRLGVSDFARLLGFKQQTVSLWLNGNIKTLPTAESLAQISRIFPDIYDSIGLATYDYLPGSVRDSWVAAISEIRRTFKEKGIAEGSNEADMIALEIFEKFGFKLTSIK